MSCTDPILSLDALIRRAARYADGCGALAVTEGDEGDAVACAQADTPSIVLAAMAFVEGASTFRVNTTNVSLAGLCGGYDLRMTCDGETAEQVFREAVTIDGTTATIRVLYVNTATEGCLGCSQAEVPLSAMVGATVVTDGTDTYILAISPDEEVDDAVDCATAEISGETFARAALTPVGSCGMWAWRVGYETLGGDFNNDFSNDFNI